VYYIPPTTPETSSQTTRNLEARLVQMLAVRMRYTSLQTLERRLTYRPNILLWMMDNMDSVGTVDLWRALRRGRGHPWPAAFCRSVAGVVEAAVAAPVLPCGSVIPRGRA